MTERNESPLKYPKEFHTLVQITGMLRALFLRLWGFHRDGNREKCVEWIIISNHLEFWKLIEAQPNKWHGIPAARWSHRCLINAHLLGQKKKNWEFKTNVIECLCFRNSSRPELFTTNVHCKQKSVLHCAAKKSLHKDIFVRQGPGFLVQSCDKVCFKTGDYWASRFSIDSP